MCQVHNNYRNMHVLYLACLCVPVLPFNCSSRMLKVVPLCIILPSEALPMPTSFQHGQWSSPSVHGCNSFRAVKPMQVQSPAVVSLACIVGFLDAGSRLRVRLERLLPQMASLSRKLPRLRVIATCHQTTDHLCMISW